MTDNDYEDTIRAITMNFCDDVGRLTMEQVKAWPNGEKMMGLAKSLCASASPYVNGLEETNRITLGIAGAQIITDVKRTASMQMPVRPAWWHFLPEAKIAIDYLGADVSKEKAVDFMKAVREIATS